MTDSIVQLHRTQPSGWRIGMFVVPLGDGRLLLYSPTWLGPKTAERISAYGKPAVVLAPNHYHHLSVGRYRDAFPELQVVAAERAHSRLDSQGLSDVADLSAADLPDGMHFLVPDGVKTGETWLSVPGDEGRTWIVCDAFFHVPGPITGAKGLLLRALKTAPGLCVGTTFWWLALKDAKAYLDWLDDRLEAERPTRVLFAHGDPLVGDDVPERLRALAHRRLG